MAGRGPPAGTRRGSGALSRPPRARPGAGDGPRGGAGVPRRRGNLLLPATPRAGVPGADQVPGRAAPARRPASAARVPPARLLLPGPRSGRAGASVPRSRRGVPAHRPARRSAVEGGAQRPRPERRRRGPRVHVPDRGRRGRYRVVRAVRLRRPARGRPLRAGAGGWRARGAGGGAHAGRRHYRRVGGVSGNRPPADGEDGVLRPGKRRWGGGRDGWRSSGTGRRGGRRGRCRCGRGERHRGSRGRARRPGGESGSGAGTGRSGGAAAGARG